MLEGPAFASLCYFRAKSTVLDKESQMSDLPTVFLDAVPKSIGKSG
jgi:hypothetical protein